MVHRKGSPSRPKKRSRPTIRRPTPDPAPQPAVRPASRTKEEPYLQLVRVEAHDEERDEAVADEGPRLPVRPFRPLRPVAVSPGVVTLPPPVVAPSSSNQRVQSVRVLVLLLGLFAMMATSLTAAVGLLAFAQLRADQAPVVALAPPVVDDPWGLEDPEYDWIEPRDEADPPVVDPPTPTHTKPAVVEAPVEPMAKDGPVVIRVIDGSRFTSITVHCESGFSERGTFVAGTATVSAVPAGGVCRAKFNGGVPASLRVSAGTDVDCHFVGATAVCE
jgi:hypothetical protein